MLDNFYFAIINSYFDDEVSARYEIFIIWFQVTERRR